MWGPQGATSGGLGTHFKTRRPFACLPPSFLNHSVQSHQAEPRQLAPTQGGDRGSWARWGGEGRPGGRGAGVTPDPACRLGLHRPQAQKGFNVRRAENS